ncbi:MAG TPA: isoprenylcysteine carboxylmethyltransferase family protein [Anaerolineales bacterium]|nr:isoprenylcysteine carboxylmethyltransferase family protein [Anaerolineales bacterium]
MTTIFGYLILAGFFLTESRIRTGQEAKSFERGQFDQRSTVYIGIAYLISMLALLLSWFFNLFGVGKLPASVGWLGVAIALSGVLVRWWANRALGAFYTRTLKVTENQFIVQEGPYRLIRHPGYLGSILMWVGVAAATANWIVLIIVLIVMLVVYVYRIENEEKMLASAQPDYAEYRKHTWRLIPLIY